MKFVQPFYVRREPSPQLPVRTQVKVGQLRELSQFRRDRLKEKVAAQVQVGELRELSQFRRDRPEGDGLAQVQVCQGREFRQLWYQKGQFP